LGARPGDLTAIAEDPQGWLRAQLPGGAPLMETAGLQSTQQILSGAEPIVRERREARQARTVAPGSDTGNTGPALADPAAEANVAMRLPQYLRPIYVNDARARLHAALLSNRPFAERLVHFWSNHFAVSVDKLAVLGIAGSFEREAIRPHVMGRFRDLLLAVETHPAMLLYLDNQQSVGPDSTLARRAAQRGRTLGLNENLAREILELHTLGVGAGYTQADVTSFAKVLTGWSIGGGQGRLANGPIGAFVFRTEVHEPGAQTIVRKRYAEADQGQGLAGPAGLAAGPPAAAVHPTARAFDASGGHLPAVYAAAIESPQAWDGATVKFKTPQDYLFSLARGLALPPASEPRVLSAFELLGQRQF